jgi:vitamin B12/bleomycin/antimicrobial peptide transport system ATP-binding/permease protein
VHTERSVESQKGLRRQLERNCEHIPTEIATAPWGPIKLIRQRNDMDTQKIPLKVTAERFIRAVRIFANSGVGSKAKLMFAGLVALLCGVNGLNVVNSYVGRNFMTSITDRNKAEFILQALFYIGVFAASTIVAVIVRFTEERLGLLWREFLTQRAVRGYLANGTYFHLEASAKLANPDQRIAEDVRAFTVTTLSFVLMVLNSSFTMVAFSGVLWSISPLLFTVAVLYAVCGSYLTIILGRPLITLNYDQLDKEASFRSGLIHVRENAESIMLAHREGRHTVRLVHRLEELVANFHQIIAVNRNVGFFTTGYNWLIQIIPALIVAPAFINGDIAFGVITQSAMAFSMLVSAFSLIVTQFQSLSTFAAVIARLSSLMEAVEQLQTTTGSGIEFVEAEGHLAYERLTFQSTNGGPLLRDLSRSRSAPAFCSRDRTRLRECSCSGRRRGSRPPVQGASFDLVRMIYFSSPSALTCRRVHCGRFSNVLGMQAKLRMTGFLGCCAS